MQLLSILPMVLLVSHGDTLQILLTLSMGLPLGRHRELKPLATAEVRALIPSPEGVLP